MQNRIIQKYSTDPLILFRELANRYAQFAGEESVRVRPYKDPALLLFSKLSGVEQEQAIEFLAEALEVFTEMKQEGLSLRDSSQLLWRSLKRLGMVPEKDIFDKLTNDHTVEVYSVNNRHLFWNLRFMEIFSLTLEQLICQPWWELASRPVEITESFMDIIGKIISGETPGTIPIRVPIHVIEEIDSEELLQVEASVKYISPLKKNGQVVGGITVAQARIVGSTRNSLSAGILDYTAAE